MKLSLSGLSVFAVALCIGIGTTVPADAEPVTSAFDGVYSGLGQVQEGLSDAGCPAPSAYQLSIRGGNIRGNSEDGAQLRGIVTSDGFFTGTYLFKDGKRVPFEGSVDDDSLVGGLMPRDECAWTLSLRKM